MIFPAQRSREWTTADRRKDGTKLPSLAQKAAELMDVGNRINPTHVEVQAHIVVAEAAIVGDVRGRKIRTPLRIDVVQWRVVSNPAATVDRVVVEALAPIQVVLRVQPVPATLIECALQTVVLRR